MLNFDQVGSRNLDKLPTNLVNWVLAMLLNLINFGSFLLDLHKLSSCKFGQL